jgi:predicted phosphodiesterase
MKIRILSDIHININHRLAPKYNKDNILTLIAGDISKNTRDTIRYINKNFNDTIFIEGNHLFYDHLIPINKKYEILHKKFPQSSNQTFLEQDYKVYQNHVIIGATL